MVAIEHPRARPAAPRLGVRSTLVRTLRPDRGKTWLPQNRGRRIDLL